MSPTNLIEITGIMVTVWRPLHLVYRGKLVGNVNTSRYRSTRSEVSVS